MASNPGINAEVQQYYRDRLHIIPEFAIKIGITPETIGPLTPDDIKDMTQEDIEIRKYKLQHYKEWQADEVAKYLSNSKLKPLLTRREADLKTDSNTITITRILGHKDRMIGSGRWLMQNAEPGNCWTCDMWTFTIFFWNEEIGKANERNKIGVDSATKTELVNAIRMHNNESYMTDESFPVLFSNCTNWKPKPFWRLIDFLNSVEPTAEPEYDKVALDDAMDEFNFTDINNLRYDLSKKV